MKVLHYSDKSSDQFCKLYSECDLVIATGDLMKADFMGMCTREKTAFGIYGNHCSGTYMESLGIYNLHNKVFDYNGMTYGGFQGCLKYKEGGEYYTEKQAKKFADNFPHVDVLLLHAGPRGMLDDSSDIVHLGSENIRRYVIEKKPKHVFVGHQYSNAEMEFAGTKLYRTYGARIIEI
jgi:Icc-related predicted phosphoesterase